MSEMRIALEVRLYEDVLYELHLSYRDHPIPFEQMRLIRRLEANAHEVTWKRPNKRFPSDINPWYERDPFIHDLIKVVKP
jgi:hypothetical protein